VIHNHGPEEGAGLACNVTRLPDGSLRGDCLIFQDLVEGKRTVNDVRRMAGIVSSTYYILCMNHNPAMVAGEFSTSRCNDAVASLKNLDETGSQFEQHPHCDLIISRVSGAPVEFGCVARTQKQRIYHSEVHWVEADWLRLLYHTQKTLPDDEFLQSLRSKHDLKCWTPERLHNLRFELGMED